MDEIDEEEARGRKEHAIGRIITFDRYLHKLLKIIGVLNQQDDYSKNRN